MAAYEITWRTFLRKQKINFVMRRWHGIWEDILWMQEGKVSIRSRIGCVGQYREGEKEMLLGENAAVVWSLHIWKMKQNFSVKEVCEFDGLGWAFVYRGQYSNTVNANSLIKWYCNAKTFEWVYLWEEMLGWHLFVESSGFFFIWNVFWGLYWCDIDHTACVMRGKVLYLNQWRVCETCMYWLRKGAVVIMSD